MLASAQGVNLNGFAIGRIKVADQLLVILPDDEVEFVLAHEVAHIFRNHYADAFTAAAARTFAEGAAREEPAVRLALLAWDALNVIRATYGQLSLVASATRAHELEADALAVALTRDKEGAKRALLRLVGYDLDAPSHTWEVWGKTMPLPVLSIRDRIDALERLPY